MHILFVHQNYPAQFGHLARSLQDRFGWQCSFLTQREGVEDSVSRMLTYRPKGGATRRTSYLTRTFENSVGHAAGVYLACRRLTDLKPDLIVGHSGFGSTVFLRELFPCPIVNYFEYFYRPHGSDLDFRPEFPPKEADVLRSYCRNAMVLLDLENCDAGYSPTHWQKSLFPSGYQSKIEVLFDGVDTNFWRRRSPLPRELFGRTISPDVKIVTYVSRGLEALRGFDIFLRLAKRVYERYPNVLFVVVGTERSYYGGDKKYIQEESFKAHALKQDEYNLSKFLFTGRIAPAHLANLLSLSDAHVYLTAPFVPSWSLFNAMACGCPIVASDVPPVVEIVQDGVHGRLANFYDVPALAEHVLELLRNPATAREFGDAARRTVEERYALDVTLPRTAQFLERVANRHGTAAPLAAGLDDVPREPPHDDETNGNEPLAPKTIPTAESPRRSRTKHRPTP